MVNRLIIVIWRNKTLLMTDHSTDVLIEAGGGWKLAGLLYEPVGAVDEVIVLNGATGVPRDFYRRFARWCAEEHHSACLIYDYRDFGASQTKSPRNSQVTMVDWGIFDQQAAIGFMLERFSGRKVTVIGHSLGGMFLQYHSRTFAGQIERAVTIASGTGFWLSHPLYYLPVVGAFWWLVGPLATLLSGYTPGRALGLGTDLPASIYWQWRRWCTSRRFYRIDQPDPVPAIECPGKVDFPVNMLAISDDPMMPLAAVKSLSRFYDCDEMQVKIVRPEDAGLHKLGHIQTFSYRNNKFWPLILAR